MALSGPYPANMRSRWARWSAANSVSRPAYPARCRGLIVPRTAASTSSVTSGSSSETAVNDRYRGVTATRARSTSMRLARGRSPAAPCSPSAPTARTRVRSARAPSSSSTSRAPSSRPDSYGCPLSPGVLPGRTLSPLSSSCARASAPASRSPISCRASSDGTPARARSCSSVALAFSTLTSSGHCRPPSATLIRSSSSQRSRAP